MHRVAWTSVFFVALVSSPAEAEEPPSFISALGDDEIELLLNAIPSLDLGDESLNSFEISGRLPSPTSPTMPIHARLGWSRDVGTSMLICTAKSKTPVLWAVDNQALICDFTEAKLTVIKDVHAQALFRIVDDEIKYRYRLYSAEVTHLIEPRSFVNRFGRSWTASREDDVATLSAASQSGRSTMTLRFQNGVEPRFLGFVMSTNDTQRTVLNSIDSITVNEARSPALLTFPRELLADSDVPVVERAVRDRSDLSALTAIIIRALTVQSLLEDADLRRTVAPRLPYADVDWAQSQRRFEDVAPKLRHILGQVQGDSKHADAKLATTAEQGGSR